MQLSLVQCAVALGRCTSEPALTWPLAGQLNILGGGSGRTGHSALGIVHCVLYTVYCTLCIVHGVLYTVYCTLCIVHGELYTVYCTRCIVHGVLYTVHCTLYIINCIL